MKRRKLFEAMDPSEQNGLPVLTARQSLGGSDAADVTDYGIPCVERRSRCFRVRS